MTLSKYILGFVLSLILTLTAYSLAIHGSLPRMQLVAALLALACVQFLVQAVLFLHVRFKKGSCDRLFALCAACVVIFILVSGSMWIMFHLNQRMMADPGAMQQYMNDQQGI